MSDSLMFRCQDRWNREIVLVEDVWKSHILANHPEFQADHLACILEAIEQATFINHDADLNRANTECYYRDGGHPDEIYSHLMVKVCVKFVDQSEPGYVSTAIVTSKVPSGEVRKWPS